MSMLNNIQRQLQNPQAAEVYPLTNRPNSLKAISHRPDLAHRVHVLTQTASGVTDEELGAYADFATVFKIYPWVRKAITVIANALSPLPVMVENADGEAQPNHPVSILLSNGNDQQSPNELWEKWVVHMFLGGEALFEIVDDQRGRPVEFWARRPDAVGLKIDESPERLLYPRPALYTYQDEDIQPENMWHSKFYNPLNQWRGLAPITALRQGIVIDMFAQAWSKKFLKDGARPDYAVVSPEALTPTEKEDIEQSLMMKFSGPDNWHKPVILSDGAKIETFSFAPKDIEWLEQRRFSRDEVGAVFGVPDEIMGYGRDTYENFETALKVLWVLTIAPLAQRRDVGLTHFFTKVRPLLGAGERVVTDFSSVGTLQEDLAPKLEQASKLFGMGVPFDVIDDRLGLGIGAVPGGNVGYLPLNLLPVGTERNAPTADNQQLAADGVKKKSHEPIEFGSALHKALYKQFEARLTEKERPFQRELKRQFQRQQNDVLRAIRQRGVSGEVTKNQIDIPSPRELFNVKVWNSEFTEVFFPFFQDTIEGFGQNALDDLGLGIDFSLVDPFVSAAIKDITIVFANDINATTQTRIAETLTAILDEATQNGLSVPQVQSLIYDRISDVFNVRKSDYETERIARTELAEAANLSTILSGRQAASNGLRVRKAWLAALDDRTRDSHAAAHRRYQRDPIPLEDDFRVGSCKGVAPGNTGCKEEDINCRCSTQLIPV